MDCQAVLAAPIIPAVTARNYRYSLSGDNPPWRPVSLHDDGRHGYVEFARGIVQGELPPIFVIGSDGEAQIINSRIYQNLLIVDCLFAAAELRLGGGYRQQAVQIVRTDGRPGS
ncbi:conjugal transfer protein [Acetobacteraceae bacterium AT-5844]|nr:conjugal transfer protein [Acetobacteraceae bacterium AT-5844]